MLIYIILNYIDMHGCPETAAQSVRQWVSGKAKLWSAVPNSHRRCSIQFGRWAWAIKRLLVLYRIWCRQAQLWGKRVVFWGNNTTCAYSERRIRRFKLWLYRCDRSIFAMLSAHFFMCMSLLRLPCNQPCACWFRWTRVELPTSTKKDPYFTL